MLLKQGARGKAVPQATGEFRVEVKFKFKFAAEVANCASAKSSGTDCEQTKEPDCG